MTSFRCSLFSMVLLRHYNAHRQVVAYFCLADFISPTSYGSSVRVTSRHRVSRLVPSTTRGSSVRTMSRQRLSQLVPPTIRLISGCVAVQLTDCPFPPRSLLSSVYRADMPSRPRLVRLGLSRNSSRRTDISMHCYASRVRSVRVMSYRLCRFARIRPRPANPTTHTALRRVTPS